MDFIGECRKLPVLSISLICSSSKQAITTSHEGNLNRLRDGTCVNNNGTTWTYNQGVILSGLALLYNATGNASLLDIAQKIADATIQRLIYSDGILKEPCEPNCNDDQKLFKGIFVRHLTYLIPYLTDAAHIQRYRSFLQQNGESVWTSRHCELDGSYSLIYINDISCMGSIHIGCENDTTIKHIIIELDVVGSRQLRG